MGRELLQIAYRDNQIGKFKRAVLSSGKCTFFFKMNFCSDKDQFYAIVDTGNYKRLKDYKALSAIEALNVLIFIVKGMCEGKNFYIFPGTYILRPENLYINRDFTGIKAIYISNDNCKLRASINEIKRHKVEVSDQIFDFLFGACSKYAKEYIDRARDLLNDMEYGENALLVKLSELKRQAYKNGVDSDPVLTFFQS